ncbi:hypothetical protein F4X90_22715 [Candidatus Poribacteria bacterium]|nr:hypothetical protein [Candidatus Poribacteria bacterium]
MKRFLMLFFLISIILSFIVVSLEGIPVQESGEHPQKIKVLLDVAGEKDLKPLVEEYLFEAFSSAENIDVVLEIEEGIAYVVSVVLVEARAGENRQKTGNLAACVQYIDYFDNSILKPDVAVSNWERVSNLTVNLIEHSQTGLYLIAKNDLENMTNGVFAKFQKLFLESQK